MVWLSSSLRVWREPVTSPIMANHPGVTMISLREMALCWRAIWRVSVESASTTSGAGSWVAKPIKLNSRAHVPGGRVRV